MYIEKNIQSAFAPHEDLNGATFIAEVLPQWTDLLESRRRDIASALHCFGRGVDVPLNQVLLAQAAIEPLVAKAHRRGAPIHPNYLGHIKYVLARLSEANTADLPKRELSAVWQALYDRIPAAFDRFGLVRFLRYCSQRDLAPEQVNRESLESFETYLAEDCQELKAKKVGQTTVKAWNHARQSTEGWPQQKLSHQTRPRQVTLPLTGFPASFQADVAKFQASMTCSTLTGVSLTGGGLTGSKPPINPFSQLKDPKPPSVGSYRRRKKPARPATVKSRTYQILQAAAALVELGHKPEDITSLRCLVQPFETAAAIAEFHWARTGERANSNAAGIVDLLRLLGKHHFGWTEDQVRNATDWLGRLTPSRGMGMTPKNARRLKQLVSPDKLPVLLHLPNELMNEADHAPNPAEAARLALQAAALEILLIFPMRLKNLRELRLGIHFQGIENAHKGGAIIALDADEMKNEQPMLWPIPAKSGELIRRYVTRYRPTLAAPTTDYLFPGRDGGARSECGMREALCKPAAARGLDLNPHLGRSFAIWLFLKNHPGQYEMARRILGHRRVEMTIKYYAGLEAQFAAVAYDRVLFAERQKTAVAARALIAKRKGIRTPNKGGR